MESSSDELDIFFFFYFEDETESKKGVNIGCKLFFKTEKQKGVIAF